MKNEIKKSSGKKSKFFILSLINMIVNYLGYLAGIVLLILCLINSEDYFWDGILPALVVGLFSIACLIGIPQLIMLAKQKIAVGKMPAIATTIILSVFMALIIAATIMVILSADFVLIIDSDPVFCFSLLVGCVLPIAPTVISTIIVAKQRKQKSN